ncbi:MAG TPA: transporter [Nitrospirota bacterium]|nr:transporter [Nitrospirota bacterium]
MRIAISVFIICIVLSAPVSVWAAHPFLVEDTDIQGTGNFKLELNSDKTKKDEDKISKLSSVIRWGVSESADVSLDVPYYTMDPGMVPGHVTRGYGDIQLGLKQRTYQNEVHQSFAYELYTTVPTGNKEKGLGTDRFVVGLKLIDQQECRGSNCLHASVGYESFVSDMKNKHFNTDYAVTYGLAAERKFTPRLRLLMEVAGDMHRTKETGRTAKPFTAMAGLRYDLFKSWYIDLAGRVGLNKDAEDNTLLLGTAWKF